MTTPTRSAPSATGRQYQESQKSIACLKAGPNRRLHRYVDPRNSAEARRCRSAHKRFFSSTGRGAEGELPRRGKRSPSGGFSFWRNQKENGGASPVETAPLREQKPPKGAHPLQNAQCLRRAAVLPPEAPAALTPPSVPFPSWPAAHPDACSCRPSASAGPSPPASDHPR